MKAPEKKMDETGQAVQDATGAVLAAQGQTDQEIPHAPAEEVLTTEEDTTGLEDKKTVKGDKVPEWLGKHAGSRLVQFFPNHPTQAEAWALVSDGVVVAQVDMTDSRIVSDELVVEAVPERVYTQGTSVLTEKRFSLP